MKINQDFFFFNHHMYKFAKGISIFSGFVFFKDFDECRNIFGFYFV